MRDCACRALEALARKRSTKACMCLRAASCLTRLFSCSSRLLGALALELVVAAAPEGQLLLVEMDDRVDRAVEQVAVVADQQHGVRIVARHSSPATACLRGRDSWSARRAAAGRARQTARRPAPRACASRRRRTRPAASAPRRRSRGRRGWWRRALRPNARRCRPAACGFRRCGAGRSPSAPRRAAPRARCRP